MKNQPASWQGYSYRDFACGHERMAEIPLACESISSQAAVIAQAASLLATSKAAFLLQQQ